MKSIQNTVFTPELPERSAGEMTLKTGTTTIGILCKDCVVMAADRRATAGHMIVMKKAIKVLPVSDSIVVTTAGNFADLQLLYKYLSAELKVKRIRSGRAVFVKEAANLLGTWVYNLIRSTMGVAHFLVGGYDSAPALYDVYPDGSVSVADDYVTSGSGSVFALGVLESKYSQGLSRDEGVKLAEECIRIALTRDSGSGNGVDVYVIDKNGAKHVVSKEIVPTVKV